MKRIKVKPRKVNLDTVRMDDGKIIYAGDSLHTVPCPNNITKGMKQNLRRTARSSAVDFDRRKCAYNVMVEDKISTKRVKNKRQRRKTS